MDKYSSAMEGPVAWYEAYLNSERVGTFMVPLPGSPVPLIGLTQIWVGVPL